MAANDAPQIGNDEVYYELKTGQFGGRFTAGATKEHTVAMLAEPNAEIVLYYWMIEGDAQCGDSSEYKAIKNHQVPASVNVRAAARVGPEVGHQQKYTTRVGPLYINRRYCFTAEKTVKRTLGQEEQAQIDAALEKAIKGQLQLARVVVENGENDPKTARESAKGELKMSEIAAALGKNLVANGWTAEQLKVEDPYGKTTLSLPEAFLQIAERDDEFSNALERRLDILSNHIDTRKHLLGALAALRKPAAPLIYDPLLKIEPTKVTLVNGKVVKFSESVKDEAVRKALAAVLDNKEAFVAEVWKQRTRLIDPDDRQRLASQHEAVLSSFLKQPDDLFVGWVQVTPHQITQLQKSLQDALDGDPPKLAQMVELASGTLNRLRPTRGEVDWCARDEAKCKKGFVNYAANEADLKSLKSLKDGLDSLKEVVEHQIANPAAYNPPTLERLPGYTALRAALRAVQRSATTPAAVVKEANFSEGIPLYATADVGFLAPFYDQGAPDDLLAYFGVSFYFAAVDKDERLRGLDFWRRFSLVGGITLSSPSTGAEQGIGGSIGDKAALGGAGVRITDYLRVGGGALFLTQQPQLSSDKKLRVAPYVGLSVDIDVAAQIRAWHGGAGESGG